MESKPRKHYDKEYKIMAIELANLRGNTAQAARELDIRPGLLTKWVYNSRFTQIGRQEFQKSASSGLSSEQLEIRQLKEELEFARMERDILKKAVSIFSKNEGIGTR